MGSERSFQEDVVASERLDEYMVRIQYTWVVSVKSGTEHCIQTRILFRQCCVLLGCWTTVDDMLPCSIWKNWSCAEISIASCHIMPRVLLSVLLQEMTDAWLQRCRGMWHGWISGWMHACARCVRVLRLAHLQGGVRRQDAKFSHASLRFGETVHCFTCT